ncbi:MAG: hypothetical protein M9910_04675 [Kiritimatiellae bacterium]|nr:hypothetical protein [Kiritimatiellia bacterium]
MTLFILLNFCGQYQPPHPRVWRDTETALNTLFAKSTVACLAEQER